MMYTALSIMQQVRRRLNLDIPSTIESVTDPDELQQKQELIEVCEQLRQGRCFPVSKRTYSFATVSGTSKYLLPKDFYGTIIGTVWNQTDAQPMVGPNSDAYFNYLLYGEVSSTTDFSYRLFGPDQNPNSEGGQFEVYPTPSSAKTISFDYISRHMFLPQNWEPSTAYSLNDEVNVNGNIYVCTSAGTSSADDPPSGTATSGITDGTAEWGYDNEPYEAPVLNTDLCIFDYDLVKLGLRAAWIQDANGSAADNLRIEFNSRIDKAQTRMQGSFVGSMIRRDNVPRYSFPRKSWSFS